MGSASTPLEQYTIINDELDSCQKIIQSYIFQLATGDQFKYWEDIIKKVLPDALTHEKERCELLFVPSDLHPFVTTTDDAKCQTYMVILKFLAGKEFPEKTTAKPIKVALRELSKSLQCPGQLMPGMHKKDNIVINGYDVTALIIELNRIYLLRYLIQSYALVADYQPEVLEIFSPQWLETQANKTIKVCDNLQNHVKIQEINFNKKFQAENIGIAIANAVWTVDSVPVSKISVQPFQHSTSLKKFWHNHQMTAWSKRFAIGSIFKPADRVVVTDPAPGSPWLINQLLKIIFWLHIPMIFSILKNMVFLSFIKTLNECWDFVTSKKPYETYNTAYHPAISLWVQCIKILCLPFLMLGPLALGLTSIPLLQLREWWLDLFGQYETAKSMLYVLDFIELVKDCIVMMFGVGLLVNYFSSFITVPAILLSVGTPMAALITIAAATLLIVLKFVDAEKYFEFLFGFQFQIPNLPTLIQYTMVSPFIQTLGIAISLGLPLSLTLLSTARVAINILGAIKDVALWILGYQSAVEPQPVPAPASAPVPTPAPVPAPHPALEKTVPEVLPLFDAKAKNDAVTADAVPAAASVPEAVPVPKIS